MSYLYGVASHTLGLSANSPGGSLKMDASGILEIAKAGAAVARSGSVLSLVPTALAFIPGFGVIAAVVGLALGFLNSGEQEGKIHEQENTQRDYYRFVRWAGMIKVLAVEGTKSWYKFFKLMGRGVPLTDAQKQAIASSVNVFDDFIVTPHYQFTWNDLLEHGDLPEGQTPAAWNQAVSKIPRDSVSLWAAWSTANNFPYNQPWFEFLANADESIKGIERVLHEFFVVRILKSIYDDRSDVFHKLSWGSAADAYNFPLVNNSTSWDMGPANNRYYWYRPTLEKFDEIIRITYGANWTLDLKDNALQIVEKEEAIIAQEIADAKEQAAHDAAVKQDILLNQDSGLAVQLEAQKAAQKKSDEELMAAVLLLTMPDRQQQLQTMKTTKENSILVPILVLGGIAFAGWIISKNFSELF